MKINKVQKAFLVIALLMFVVFTAIYGYVSSRKGFEYQETILVRSEQDRAIDYSGKIKGVPVSFLVEDGRSVVYKCGDKSFGPYIYQEDPDAASEIKDFNQYMVGYNISKGSETVFRGGAMKYDSGEIYDYLIYKDNGEFLPSLSLYFEQEDMDPYDEPDIYTIISLFLGPRMRHKGDWRIWGLTDLLLAVMVISLFTADKAFRFRMSLRLKDPGSAEPSEFEMAGRYIAWTVLLIASAVFYVIGLRMISL